MYTNIVADFFNIYNGGVALVLRNVLSLNLNAREINITSSNASELYTQSALPLEP